MLTALELVAGEGPQLILTRSGCPRTGVAGGKGSAAGSFKESARAGGPHETRSSTIRLMRAPEIRNLLSSLTRHRHEVNPDD